MEIPILCVANFSKTSLFRTPSAQQVWHSNTELNRYFILVTYNINVRCKAKSSKYKHLGILTLGCPQFYINDKRYHLSEHLLLNKPDIPTLN